MAKNHEPGSGYCPVCGQQCAVLIEDNGIGAYEYWGAKGTHHDYQAVSACCGEVIDDYEEQESEYDKRT